ncbi:hypothetical protein RIR_jg21193.t1 [Rhizophagus irregularis DAOM 181602=DAOM 197198]|nr:hypothetical protein RIR_jg21193.t1 [Rhizophagus irregularis DAOM 181602=DAOM 197198]
MTIFSVVGHFPSSAVNFGGLVHSFLDYVWLTYCDFVHVEYKNKIKNYWVLFCKKMVFLRNLKLIDCYYKLLCCSIPFWIQHSFKYFNY